MLHHLAVPVRYILKAIGVTRHLMANIYLIPVWFRAMDLQPTGKCFILTAHSRSNSFINVGENVVSESAFWFQITATGSCLRSNTAQHQICCTDHCAYFFPVFLFRNFISPERTCIAICTDRVCIGYFFYTLLLSISEYIAFAQAYLVASASTVLLIGWYSKSIFKSGESYCSSHLF